MDTEWLDRYQDWLWYREAHVVEGAPHYSERAVVFSNEDAVRLLNEAALLLGYAP